MIFNTSDLVQLLSARARAARLAQNITQMELASKVGVGVATVKRFEKDGSGSIEFLCKLAFALGLEEGFYTLFVQPQPTSIDDITRGAIKRQRSRKRKRDHDTD